MTPSPANVVGHGNTVIAHSADPFARIYNQAGARDRLQFFLKPMDRASDGRTY